MGAAQRPGGRGHDVKAQLESLSRAGILAPHSLMSDLRPVNLSAAASQDTATGLTVP